MDSKNSSTELVELTADIVSAYVTKNSVVATELPQLIDQTFDALRDVAEKKGPIYVCKPTSPQFHL